MEDLTLYLKYEILKRKYAELKLKYDELLNLIDMDFWNVKDISSEL